jgi:hypothetical protein
MRLDHPVAFGATPPRRGGEDDRGADGMRLDYHPVAFGATLLVEEGRTTAGPLPLSPPLMRRGRPKAGGGVAFPDSTCTH